MPKATAGHVEEALVLAAVAARTHALQVEQKLSQSSARLPRI